MSSSDLSSSNFPQSGSHSSSGQPTQTQGVNAPDVDLEAAFRLVDYILPYPACFYHELLPLSLTEQVLTVAMVNPNDSSALDFLVSILESMEQVPQLETRLIDKDILTAILSAYLNTNRRSSPFNSDSSNQTTLLQDHKFQNKVDRSTLILDEDQDEDRTGENGQEQVAAKEAPTHRPTPARSANQGSSSSRTLSIHPQYLSAPPEFLTSLPPQQLLIEILGRVLLEGGIGRLYFERHINQGRILCSQNGVAQVTVENISVALFQGTLNELKKMARIRPEPLQKTRKFDIAQYYQGKPLLLRLRFMPGKNGEEATLQVLRGKALSFYQRQQIEKIAQETLQIAKQLERKVTQINLRQRFNEDPVVAVSQLKQVLNKLAQQLDAMEK